MKIIFTLTALCLSLIVSAQNSSLTIFNNNGQQFFVIINGIRQNSLPSTNLRIESLSTETAYEVKLIFADGKTADINKKLWFDEAGAYLARVDFKKKNKKGKLKYFGMTPAGGNNSNGATPVNYRPNDRAGYSDQQTSGSMPANQQISEPDPIRPSQTNTNTSTTTTVPQSTTTTTVNPDGSVTQITTVVNPDGTVTETTTTSTNTNVNMQSGANGNTQAGGVNQSSTTVDTTDPGMTGVSINMNVSGMDSNTVYDPNNPGSAGVNIQVSGNGMDPNNQGGTINVSTNAGGMDQNGNYDPNAQINVNTSVNGSQTSQSGSSQSATVTTTQTVNGQTTTTTSGGTVSNGQMNQVNNTTSNSGANGIQQQPMTSGMNYNCTKVLVNEDDFIEELNDMSFDDDKKTLILEDLKGQCVSAQQAAKILEVLSFEDDRLELAKFFYERMTDRANAKQFILPLFKFDSTKMEFREYLRERGE